MARRKRDERKVSQTETRKFQLRERKERRERQMLLAVLAPVLIFVVAVLIYGAYTELYMKPKTPVAKVEGENITTDEFVSRVSWLRPQLVNELSNFMQFASASDTSFLTNYAEGRRSSLPEDARDQLIDDVLVCQEAEARGIEVASEDIDARIREDLEPVIAPPEAEEPLVVEASDLDVTGDITATDEITSTATPIPTEEIGSAFQRYIVDGLLLQAEMTVNEYRNRVVRPQVYRSRLEEALGDELPTSETQVEAGNIRFTSEETAQKAVGAFGRGDSWDQVLEQFGPPDEEEPEEADAELEGEDTALEDDDAVAEEATPEDEALVDEPGSGLDITGQLTDTEEITDTGEITDTAVLTTTDALTDTISVGPTPVPTPVPDPFAFAFDDRKWLTRMGIADGWGLEEEAADEVMGLEPVACAGPYQVGGTTWYVVCVFDAADDREIDADEMEDRRSAVLQDWLDARKLEAAIDKFPLEGLIPAEPAWFVQTMLTMIEPQPTLDLSSLQESVPGADADADAPPVGDDGAAPEGSGATGGGEEESPGGDEGAEGDG